MAAKASFLEEVPSSRMVSSRLHNFTFLTAGWGAGLALRCIKVPTVVVGRESGGLPEEVPCPPKFQSISPEAVEKAELPWNLRRRRTLYKKESPKSVGGASAKRKLMVSLSSKEIEADFVLMNGKKPHKRPKKRPKHVQKQLDTAFPGLWLSEVTPDMYNPK